MHTQVQKDKQEAKSIHKKLGILTQTVQHALTKLYENSL